MLATTTSSTVPLNLHNLWFRQSQVDDLETVIDLLVDGYGGYPLWDLIDLHENLEAERFVFGAAAKLMINAGQSYLIYHGDDVVVGHVSMALPGARVVPPTWEVVKVTWQIPFRFGLDFTLRFMDLLDSIDTQTEKHLGPLQPSAYLEWFVVTRAYRDCGIGLYVLNEFVTKDQSRVLLITEVDKTVELYKRAGFEIVVKHTLRTGYGRECESWCMVYNAPPPTAA